MPGETANGDGWRVDWSQGACRIAVIDGLGHGPQAAAAADCAQQTLKAHPQPGPEEALRLCHEALAGTRGAAISIALLDPAVRRLTYAGIGNVEARLVQEGHERRLIAYRGIVGKIMRTIHPFDYALSGPWLLILYTDGIRSRFDIEATLDPDARSLEAGANRILSQWARAGDDATVVIVTALPGNPA